MAAGVFKEDLSEIDVTIHIDDTETYTTVLLHGERYAGIGVSKRNPVDDFDIQTGVDLALARGLRDLAGNIEAGLVEAAADG